MHTEPRYTIIDNETGRRIAVSTDELQVLYWLAENEAERLRRKMRLYEFTPTGTKYGLCVSEKSYAKMMDRLDVPCSERLPFVSKGKGATTHFIETTEGLNCVVCVGDMEGHSQNEVHGLICHECVHVWQAIKEWMGENQPGEEVEAYSVQSIFVNMVSCWDTKIAKGRS